jgi:hypothetical protein
MADATSADLTTSLRNQAFEEIDRVAQLASSYSRSIGEAAYRGDDVTMLVHMKQLKSCLLSMIKTYKACFDGEGDGEDVAREAAPGRRHRQDQRSGDGVA